MKISNRNNAVLIEFWLTCVGVWLLDSRGFSDYFGGYKKNENFFSLVD